MQLREQMNSDQPIFEITDNVYYTNDGKEVFFVRPLSKAEASGEEGYDPLEIINDEGEIENKAIDWIFNADAFESIAKAFLALKAQRAAEKGQ